MIEKENKVIIVDDHLLFADGLKRIINDIPGFSVVDCCCDWNVLKLSLNKQLPDLLMLDIQIKGFNGFEICELLKKTQPSIKIILISMFDSIDIIEKCKKINANGYIPKTSDSQNVKTVIKSVIDNIDVFINPNTNENQQQSIITNREREIIELIKKGYNSQKIANKLSISRYTVDTHRKNILKKLHLNSTNELISFAYENFF